MNKVFIPHNTRRYDHKEEKLKPVFDFSQAAKFGQLTEVIGDDENVLFTDKVTSRAKSVLSTFTAGDYLLAVGDPTVIAICAGILFKSHESVKMLKWDRHVRQYIELELSL